MVIIYSLISVFFRSTKALAFRSAMKKSDKVWAAILTHNIVGALGSLIIFFPGEFPSLSFSQILLLCGVSTCWICGGLYSMRSSRFLDAASGELYGSVQFILVTVLGLMIFNESLSWLGVLGVAMIIGAIVIHSNPKGCKLDAGVAYKLVSAVFFTGGVFYTKLLTDICELSTIMIASYALPAIVYSVLKPRQVLNIVPVIKETKGVLILGGLTNIASFSFFNLALMSGDVVIVNTLGQLHLVFIFVFGLILLGEKASLIRKGTSCAVSSAGALLVCQA